MKRTIGAVLILAPGVAEACAVCGAAVDRDQNLFLGTTILLSLLPLALIGASLWWLRRQALGHAARESAAGGVQVAAPAPRPGDGIA